MLKIGVTGNIGSGKSSVEEILIKKGYKTLCADKISHELFDNNKEIREQIFNIFKTNNRFEIGNIIFRDNLKKVELEKILHPRVREEINKKIENLNEKIVFVFVPLLFEAHFENIFDKIVLVSANENIRLKRIMERNGYSEIHAQDRIKSQMKEEKKVLKCDLILKNEGSPEDLEKNVEEMLNKIGNF